MKKLTKELFIERARLVHGDKYDYSRVQYINDRTKVIIVCPIHGEFLQAPNKHLAKRGCPECGKITRGIKKRSSTSDFIEKAKKVHGDRYDYSKVDYKTAILPVEIICPKHGSFMQTPNVHLNGHGCTLCGRDANSLDKKSSTLKFIEKAKKIHGDKYDYSKVDYRYASQKVTIKCNKCGHVFEQRPNGHLCSGYGCPRCAGHDPKAERQISSFIGDELKIPHKRNDRKTLNGKELDILVHDRNFAIEHTGIYWHCTKVKKENAVSHLRDKFLACEALGIRLFTIYEDEWINKKDIVKSMISNALGKSGVIFARKTTVKQITNKVANKFLNENHIQGSTAVNCAYGLFLGDDLVSVMTFTKPRLNMGRDRNKTPDDIELSRFCNKLGTRVVGGASRLLKSFLRDNPNIKKVFSYSDNRISSGDLYKKLGFTFSHNIAPNYFYVYGVEGSILRERKQKYRKDYFKNLGMDIEGKSEFQLTESIGLYRIYDAGKRCWELNCEQLCE